MQGLIQIKSRPKYGLAIFRLDKTALLLELVNKVKSFKYLHDHAQGNIELKEEGVELIITYHD